MCASRCAGVQQTKCCIMVYAPNTKQLHAPHMKVKLSDRTLARLQYVKIITR